MSFPCRNDPANVDYSAAEFNAGNRQAFNEGELLVRNPQRGSIGVTNGVQGVQRHQRALLASLRALQHGYVGPVQYEISSFGGGAGLFLRRCVRRGEVLFAIPAEAIIALPTALAANDRSADHNAELTRIWREEGERASLAALVAFEWLTTASATVNTRRSYLSTLPWHKACVSGAHVLYWTAQEVSQLRGTCAFNEARALRAEVEAVTAQLVHGILKAQVELHGQQIVANTVRDAFVFVLSRVFRMSGAKGEYRALVPLLDAMQHGPSPSVDYACESVADGSMRLVGRASRRLERGHELVLDYGDHPDFVFGTHYGFVPPLMERPAFCYTALVLQAYESGSGYTVTKAGTAAAAGSGQGGRGSREVGDDRGSGGRDDGGAADSDAGGSGSCGRGSGDGGRGAAALKKSVSVHAGVTVALAAQIAAEALEDTHPLTIDAMRTSEVLVDPSAALARLLASSDCWHPLAFGVSMEMLPLRKQTRMEIAMAATAAANAKAVEKSKAEAEVAAAAPVAADMRAASATKGIVLGPAVTYEQLQTVEQVLENVSIAKVPVEQAGSDVGMGDNELGAGRADSGPGIREPGFGNTVALGDAGVDIIDDFGPLPDVNTRGDANAYVDTAGAAISKAAASVVVAYEDKDDITTLASTARQQRELCSLLVCSRLCGLNKSEQDSIDEHLLVLLLHGSIGHDNDVRAAQVVAASARRQLKALRLAAGRDAVSVLVLRPHCVATTSALRASEEHVLMRVLNCADELFT